jgi:hypothetical protein
MSGGGIVFPPLLGGKIDTSKVRMVAPLIHNVYGVRGAILVESKVSRKIIENKPFLNQKSNSKVEPIFDSPVKSTDSADYLIKIASVMSSLKNSLERKVGKLFATEDDRQSAYESRRKQRMEERFERRDRLNKKSVERDGFNMGSMEDFLREMEEDVADEQEILYGGQSPYDFDITRVLLKLPSGKEIDLLSELGGAHYENVVDAKMRK